MYNNLPNNLIYITTLGKFKCKINVILSGLEKYMSFNINNKLIS